MVIMRMREKFKYNNNKNNGSSFKKDLSNINRKQVILGSLTKLNPFYLAKNNAVMFTVEVGFVLVFAIGLALPTIPKSLLVKLRYSIMKLQ
jgi:high-affinity K+ transport system ATPase subunit B